MSAARVTDRLLTLGDVADYLGCSVRTVKRRVRAGGLPAYRDGRLVRVREADLARYVAERVARAAPAAIRPVRAAGPRLRPGEKLWD